MSSKGNVTAVIGQSGGPTSVINQSLVGVIQAVRKARHIHNLLGARHGVRGIVNEDFINLNDVPDELLERIAVTPAAGCAPRATSRTTFTASASSAPSPRTTSVTSSISA